MLVASQTMDFTVQSTKEIVIAVHDIATVIFQISIYKVFPMVNDDKLSQMWLGIFTLI